MLQRHNRIIHSQSKCNCYNFCGNDILEKLLLTYLKSIVSFVANNTGISKHVRSLRRSFGRITLS